MTYSSGGSGYPPAQSPGSYGAAPSFAKTDDNAGSPQSYLAGAVIVLGLVAYLVSFGKMFTTMLPGGEELVQSGGGFPVAAALLAALLAAAGLLPKAKNYLPVVAAVSVLGALLLIENTISATGRGWALWVVLSCTVLQACAAAGALLLDSGVIAPPAPRPKYDQYSQYGQYGGGYYGQQPTPYQQHAPQQSGYGSQYGSYPSSPSTGGFGAVAPQQSQPGPQQGTPTPPTGFPTFSPPPSGGSGSGSGQNQADSGSSQSGQTHDSQGQGQGQQSSSAGPAQS